MKITNDGKGKYQSFQATVEKLDVGSTGVFSFEISGFGSDESEARANCRKSALLAISDVAKAIE